MPAFYHPSLAHIPETIYEEEVIGRELKRLDMLISW